MDLLRCFRDFAFGIDERFEVSAGSVECKPGDGDFDDAILLPYPDRLIRSRCIRIFHHIIS